MTRQNRGRKSLGRDAFRDIKLALETSSVATTATAFGYSETTIRRIKRSETFDEYKGYIAASNGSKVFNENEFERELETIKATPDTAYFESYTNDYPVEEHKGLSRWVVVVLILVVLAFLALIVWGVTR